jgi:acetyl esterase/lipase
MLNWFHKAYVAGGTEDVQQSPVYSELASMPPVLIQTGSGEVLRVDAERMAARLANCGVECRLQIWDRQAHDFHLLADLLSDGRAAIDDIALFIHQVTKVRA